MAYFPSGLGPQSDAAATEVEASREFVAAGEFTTPVDVVGFRSVDFVIHLTTMASVTEVTCFFSATVAANPSAPGDWFQINAEDEDPNTPGVYEANTYKVVFKGLSASDNGKKRVVSIPCRGLKMGAVIVASAGAVGGSAYKVDAVRRV